LRAAKCGEPVPILQDELIRMQDERRRRTAEDPFLDQDLHLLRAAVMAAGKGDLGEVDRSSVQHARIGLADRAAIVDRDDRQSHRSTPLHIESHVASRRFAEERLITPGGR
jgi:hypothetical protein